MSKRKQSEQSQDDPEPKRQKTYRLVIDDDAEPPAMTELTEIEEKKFALGYSFMLRGVTSKSALKAAGLTLQEVRDEEETAIEAIAKKSDVAAEVWRDIKDRYQRTIYTSNPGWEIDDLRTWLNGKITNGEIAQLGQKDFDFIAKNLSHFFSNERIKTLKTDLPAFVNKATDAKQHKKALKENEDYLTTEEGKKWLKRAAKFVIDPNSTVSSLFDPTEELVNFIRLPLREITMKGTKADLDKFKKKNKTARKSLAVKHGCLPHTEKPMSEKKTKGAKGKKKSNTNKKNKSKKRKGKQSKSKSSKRSKEDSSSDQDSEDESESESESANESANESDSEESHNSGDKESVSLSDSSDDEPRLRKPKSK